MSLRLARWLLLLTLALFAACAAQPGAAPLATLPPSPTAASAAPTVEPTVSAGVAAPTAAPTAPASVSGEATSPYAGIPRSRTPEGYQVLGNPDAPVTLVMYSDFL